MDITAFPRQFARTQRFTLGVPRAFTISPAGDRVLFLRTRGGEDPVCCLWLLAGGQERLLVDPLSLGGEARDLPEAERVRRERARERASGVVAYSADAAVAKVAFALHGTLWVTGTDMAVPRQVRTAGPAAVPRIDPTGERVAYVTGGALHVVELASGSDRVLAAPESPAVTYGLAEHVAAESMHRPRGYWWAPDGQRLLAARVDNSPVQRWWIADPANPQLAPREIRYPVAGTANADVSLHVLGADGGRTEVSWDRAAFEYLATADWDSSGPLISVQSRDQRTVRILAADPVTGATTGLHTERDPAWVELTPGVPVRTGSGALVRVADLDGTRRLVVDGKAVTGDGVQIREVLGTDGESVYFAASEEPTEVHVWSYDPRRGPQRGAGHGAGNGAEGGAVHGKEGRGAAAMRLSEEPGVHWACVAGGALLLVSRTEQGRRITLSRAGQPVVSITSRDAEPLLIPRVTWLSAGSRGIRTALLLPSWHSPGARKLPVLMSPYSGPAMQLVTRARHGWFCEAQWFADCGFAVVIADGRGTRGRGPGWEKEVHGDTLTPVIEDQVEALHAAAGHCPDLDTSRVGISGWSYGGTLAAAAVIRRPDIFHAAISGAAPSDQRLYDTHWRERFLGHPDEQPENYARSSPIAEAALLRRPLLLIHGLADDNVVVAHTLRMSAALLAAGRPHRVLPLPGATHLSAGEVTTAQLLTYQLDFLRETLNA
jgi:dipeptidyl-peptidase 4